MVLNKAKDYYKNNKNRLGEQARGKYWNSETCLKKKKEKRKYGKNRYHKISEEEKNKKKSMEKNDITGCLKKKKQD